MNFLILCIVLALVSVVFSEENESEQQGMLNRMTQRLQKHGVKEESELAVPSLRTMASQPSPKAKYYLYREYAGITCDQADLRVLAVYRLDNCHKLKSGSVKFTASVTPAGRLKVVSTDYSDSKCGKKKTESKAFFPLDTCTFGTKFGLLEDLPQQPPLHGMLSELYDYGDMKTCQSKNSERKASVIEIDALGYCVDGIKPKSCGKDQLTALVYKNATLNCGDTFKTIRPSFGCRNDDFRGPTSDGILKISCI